MVVHPGVPRQFVTTLGGIHDRGVVNSSSLIHAVVGLRFPGARDLYTAIFGMNRMSMFDFIPGRRSVVNDRLGAPAARSAPSTMVFVVAVARALPDSGRETSQPVATVGSLTDDSD